MEFGKFLFVPTKQINGKVFISVSLRWNPSFVDVYDSEGLNIISQAMPSYLEPEYRGFLEHNLDSILSEAK